MVSRVLAVSAMLAVVAVTACTRDFDGLFEKTSSDDAGKPNALDCSCSACAGSSCTFKCPTGCKSCKCEPFDCPAGSACTVACTDRTICDVTCADKASGCAVTCEGSAACLCTGPGCAVPTCSLKPLDCATGYACNHDCPE